MPVTEQELTNAIMEIPGSDKIISAQSGTTGVGAAGKPPQGMPLVLIIVGSMICALLIASIVDMETHKPVDRTKPTYYLTVAALCLAFAMTIVSANSLHACLK